MRYAQIRKIDISNGEGIGVSLFIQGCSQHCKGCFNSETWDFQGGKIYYPETTEKIIELLNKPYITRFSILGGEPLEYKNLFELSCLINKIKSTYPHIKIWMWTGFLLEDLEEKSLTNSYLDYILNNIDVLVDGPFIQEEKDISLKWRGSRNQRIHYLSNE